MGSVLQESPAVFFAPSLLPSSSADPLIHFVFEGVRMLDQSLENSSLRDQIVSTWIRDPGKRISV